MAASGKQKIGLFGGTFDPVHSGHIEIGRHVLKHCGLDKILYIPAPHPPHKKSIHAAFEDRVEMLRLALQELDRSEVSLIEREISGPSYTISTVQLLKKRFPEKRLYYIIGADTLVDLPHWHKFEELISLVQLIVAGRARVEQQRIDETFEILGKNVHIDYLPETEWPVSSSAIREQLMRAERPELLPTAVYNYIVSRKLYG